MLNNKPHSYVYPPANFLPANYLLICVAVGLAAAVGPAHAKELAPVQPAQISGRVDCEGSYPKHLQGVAISAEAIFWSFTTRLVKTDLQGQRLQQVTVPDHHGDLTYHDGKVYVAVNLGKFNDPAGNADSWVYVYRADDLSLLAKHATPQVFHGAGGIGKRGERFFVVGGLPAGVPENYVYEYTSDFTFVERHTIASGHTHLGIQTTTFADDRWWFGCYGDPKILLVTDDKFQLLGRHEFDCSLGIEHYENGQLLAAGGNCQKSGCVGFLSPVVPAEQTGLKPLVQPSDR